MTNDWDAEHTARELLAILPLLSRIVAGAMQHEAGEETTLPQFRALALLAETPQTLSALARRRRVSLQSMGTVAQALVERGWIARSPDPHDRRQHLLALTEAGRAHYKQVQAQTIRTLTPLLATLGSEQLHAVQVALPALHDALTQSEESYGSPAPR
ncbi:MAG: MarR family transcriptional regulator [Chloroflexales bacterium]|nr:MarR family transcriptional regulator [Chloroflexales bacterium]